MSSDDRRGYNSAMTDWRAISDEHFLRQCRWEAFRGSGPGGQKRNKTSSAVRLIHEPSGLSGLASERRSQEQNRQQALRRLRLRIALELREAIEPASFTPPDWWRELVGSEGRLTVAPRQAAYLPAVGLVLDVLTATGGAVAEAAALLRVHTAQLVQFIQDEDKLLAAVNVLRAANHLKPLR